MTDRLIQRSADSNQENIEEETEEIATKITVNGRYRIEYKKISDDSWDILCKLGDLISNSVDDIIKDSNVVFSDDLILQLEEIHQSLQRKWDESMKMYKVEYIEKEENLSGLYVSFDTDLINDVLVQKVYNRNNEFVGDVIEYTLDEPIHKIKTIDLYIKSLDPVSGHTVYRRADDKSFSEQYNKYRDERSDDDILESSSLKSNIVESAFWSVLCVTVYGLFISSYYLIGPITALGLVLFSVLFYFAPILLPIISVGTTFGLLKCIYGTRKMDKYALFSVENN